MDIFEDLQQYDGKCFSAKIDNEYVEGRISIEWYEKKVPAFYLCQNKKCGYGAIDKKGYENSWIISDNINQFLIDKRYSSVDDFKFIEEYELTEFPTEPYVKSITIPKESTVTTFDIGARVVKARPFDEKQYCRYSGSKEVVPIGTKGTLTYYDQSDGKCHVAFDNGINWSVNKTELDLHLNTQNFRYELPTNKETIMKKEWWKSLKEEGGDYLVCTYELAKSKITKDFIYKTIHGRVDEEYFVTNNDGKRSGFCPNNKERFRLATKEESLYYEVCNKPCDIKSMPTSKAIIEIPISIVEKPKHPTKWEDLVVGEIYKHSYNGLIYYFKFHNKQKNYVGYASYFSESSLVFNPECNSERAIGKWNENTKIEIPSDFELFWFKSAEISGILNSREETLIQYEQHLASNLLQTEDKTYEYKFPLGPINITSIVGNTLKNYYYYDIPKTLIKHGSVTIHTDYSEEFAEIIAYYKEYYIVKIKDEKSNYIQLGFLEKDLEQIISIPTKVTLSNIKKGEYYTHDLWLPGSIAQLEKIDKNSFVFTKAILSDKSIIGKDSWIFSTNHFIHIPKIYLKRYLDKDYEKLTKINTSAEYTNLSDYKSTNNPYMNIKPGDYVFLFRFPTVEELNKVDHTNSHASSFKPGIYKLSAYNSNVCTLSNINGVYPWCCILDLPEYERQKVIITQQKKRIGSTILQNKETILQNKEKYLLI